MLQKTVLHPLHVAAGARLVDFAGWEMPVNYGSQMAEHHAVRQSAGIFDVGHMRVVDIVGDGATAFLRHLLANDVARLVDGRALYSCLLNERGGIKDDLIVYRRSEDRYRAVLNAATALADLEWMRRQNDDGGFGADIALREDRTIIALQGPRAAELLAGAVGTALAGEATALKAFGCCSDGGIFVGRTGYTGEDGFEIVLPVAAAAEAWQALADAGATACGLGARDTLRLEAGMNLYGQDMDEDTLPAEAGLSWTVSLADSERDFIGRAAVESTPPRYRQIGLVLEGRGVMRAHMQLRLAGSGRICGETTSGSHAPTVGHSIALARVQAELDADSGFEVGIRDRWLPVRRVKPPFVRHGKVLV